MPGPVSAAPALGKLLTIAPTIRSWMDSWSVGSPSPPVLVESGTETPIQHQPELHVDNPDDQKLQDEEDNQPGSGVTLTLEPVPQTQEASQASSDPWEGISAGPSVPDGQATPVPPPSCVHGSHRQWCMYEDLTRQHIRVLQRLQETIAERMQTEAVWQDHLLDELVQQCTMCATMREILLPLHPFLPPHPLPILPPTVPGPTQLQFHQGPPTRDSRSLRSRQHPPWEKGFPIPLY